MKRIAFVPKGSSFPGAKRSVSTLVKIAKERRKARWTPQEDAKLRDVWGEYAISRVYEALPGRTLNAIRDRVKFLKLELGIPQGYVSLREAHIRLGIHPESLKRLCRRYSIAIRTIYPSKHIKHRKMKRCFIEWDEVLNAYEKHLKKWTVRAMANEFGVAAGRLQHWMTRRNLHHPTGKMGFYTPKEYERIASLFKVALDLEKAGWSMRMMAKKLSIPESRFRYWMHKLKLSKNTPGRVKNYTEAEAKKMMAAYKKRATKKDGSLSHTSVHHPNRSA